MKTLRLQTVQLARFTSEGQKLNVRLPLRAMHVVNTCHCFLLPSVQFASLAGGRAHRMEA